MKKAVSILLTLALLFTLLPTGILPVSAGGWMEDYTWDATTATLTIHSMDDPNGYLSGADALWYAENAIPYFEYRDIAEHVIIGSDVEKVLPYSLYRFSKIQSVTMEEGATEICYGAFAYCTSLETLLLADSVNCLRDSAFFGCCSLTSVTIPKNVTNVGDEVFSGCNSLTGIYVENDNAAYSSEDGVLFNKDKTTLLIYPAGRAEAAYVIPDSVVSIEKNAFHNCSSLMSVTIPDNVTNISDSAFFYSSSLAEINVENGNTNYASEDGVLFNSDKSTLLVYPKGRLEAAYVIPDGVTNITNSAFYNCSYLTNVTIPNGVTRIGCYAFKDCVRMVDITIPDSVNSIGVEAFYNSGVYNNESNWSDCVLYVDDWLIEALDNNLEDYAIPLGTKGIASNAFGFCDSLTSVIIPNSVINVNDGAFIFCSNLKSVVIGNGVQQIERCFPHCSSLENITIGSGVKSIAQDTFVDTAFYQDESNWADGVLYIDKWLIEAKPNVSKEYAILIDTVGIADYAFCFCGNLTNIVIPDSVNCIGNYAFSWCKALTKATIPSNVNYIGECPFLFCDALTAINVAENNQNYSSVDGVLFDKAVSRLINYPVGKIGRSYTCPSTVTQIGCYAFGGCFDLEMVIVDDALTSLGDYAFQECNSLHNVYFKGNAPKIGAGVFFTIDYGMGDLWESTIIPGLTLYFIEGKDGWTNPEWNGYPTATWDGVNIPHTHSYQAVVTAPTCTEKGFTTHTCECGDSYIDTYIDALGHRYENGVCVRCGEKDPNAQKPVEFVDVPKDEWYVGAVDYAVRNGLMGGTSANTFEPESAMTRAMLVTVLWRYEGKPMGYQNTFSDVNAKDGSWYIDAVAWAAANGIVGGVGNNKFDPDGNITREQMATILYRYAKKKGIDTSKRGDLSGFPDGGKVESWAKDAVQWTVAEKIIGGSEGYLLPQGNATRAQVATILMRYIENIVKK